MLGAGKQGRGAPQCAQNSRDSPHSTHSVATQPAVPPIPPVQPGLLGNLLSESAAPASRPGAVFLVHFPSSLPSPSCPGRPPSLTAHPKYILQMTWQLSH